MATAMRNATGEGPMPGIGDGQSLKSKSVSLDFATAQNGVLTGPLIQSGSVIVDVMVVANGLGTATMNVGDATDPDRFISAGAGPVARANVGTARPFVMPVNGTIDITLSGATGGTGSVDMTVYFQPRNT
jgi:hypothetical protein